jgi:hypothetical protein
MTSEHFFLEPKYARQKSFYQKAVVTRETDGSLRLYSYGTWVATIYPEVYYVLHRHAAYSNTTVRHVNEFLMQFTRIDENLSIGRIRELIDKPQKI